MSRRSCSRPEACSVAERGRLGRIDLEFVGIDSSQASIEFAQRRRTSFNIPPVESGHEIDACCGTDLAVGDDCPGTDSQVDHPVTIKCLEDARWIEVGHSVA